MRLSMTEMVNRQHTSDWLAGTCLQMGLVQAVPYDSLGETREHPG